MLPMTPTALLVVAPSPKSPIQRVKRALCWYRAAVPPASAPSASVTQSVKFALVTDREFSVLNVDEHRCSIKCGNHARLRQQVANGQEEGLGRHVRESKQGLAV